MSMLGFRVEKPSKSVQIAVPMFVYFTFVRLAWIITQPFYQFEVGKDKGTAIDR